MLRPVVLVVLVLASLAAQCSAFVSGGASLSLRRPQPTAGARLVSSSVCSTRCHAARPSTLRLRAEDREGSSEATPVSVAEEAKEAEPKAEVVPVEASFNSNAGSQLEEGKPYPIEFPAYGLLALSTVTAICFVGSIFEAAGPSPVLGYPGTYIVGTLSLPTFLFLFYASIKKGQAESQEDDW